MEKCGKAQNRIGIEELPEKNWDQLSRWLWRQGGEEMLVGNGCC